MWSKLLGTLSEVGEVAPGYTVSDFYTNEYLPQ
jgi:hypothetical protein